MLKKYCDIAVHHVVAHAVLCDLTGTGSILIMTAWIHRSFLALSMLPTKTLVSILPTMQRFRCLHSKDAVAVPIC